MTHLRRFEIERYLTDDLPPEEKGRLDAHLNTCSECEDKVASTRKQFGVWDAPPLDVKIFAAAPARVSSSSVADLAADADEVDPPSWRRRAVPIVAAGALAAAALIGIAIADEPAPTSEGVDRLKGIGVAVHLRRGNRVDSLERVGAVRDGDQLRFEVTSDADGVVAVVMATPDGDAEIWYPSADEEFHRVSTGQKVLLPGSVELSDLHTLNYVYVSVFPEPVGRVTLLRAARLAASRDERVLGIGASGQWSTVLEPSR